MNVAVCDAASVDTFGASGAVSAPARRVFANAMSTAFSVMKLVGASTSTTMDTCSSKRSSFAFGTIATS